MLPVLRGRWRNVLERVLHFEFGSDHNTPKQNRPELLHALPQILRLNRNVVLKTLSNPNVFFPVPEEEHIELARIHATLLTPSGIEAQLAL
jgi:hypothetical protein